MKTYKASGGTIFQYNSDFSAKVIVGTPYESVHQGNTRRYTEIPGEDLLEFVAYCYVAGKRIEQIEQMDYKELLTR